MDGILLLAYVAVIVLIIASIWVVFTKAGEPGWAAIIPFYNLWVEVKIARLHWVWFLLFFIPFANIVALFVVPINIAKQFGKGAGFGIGLALLGFIFFPILAWGDATYQGGDGGDGAMPQPVA